MMAVTSRTVKVVLFVFINLLAILPTITPNSQAMVSIPIGGEIRDIAILPSGENEGLGGGGI